ncbi:MAG TPA: 3'-5' exonuclease, partial [Candidatus Saccharimonadia bacterium]|nr:3'-5' exonuclease [Candidatus Saccharimonadia bacterium]
PEAAELATVLDALADPADLRRGRAALATELGGFDDLALRAMKADGAALDEALALLAQWREIALAHGPAALARTLAQRVGPRWLARHDGRRRMTNLAHVGEALQREARALPGLPAQAAWLARRIARGLQSEDAELRPDAGGAPVAVLTVHKSKGLEWDVVFAPFLWCGRRDAHEQDRVALEHRRPVGFHGAEGGLRVDLGSRAWDDHMAQKLEEEAAESVRLAYVALTRARHRVYTYWGCARDADSSPLAHLLHPFGEVPIDRAGVQRQLEAWSAHARGAVVIVPLPSASDGLQGVAQHAGAQQAGSGATAPSGVIPAKAATQHLENAEATRSVDTTDGHAPPISARPFRATIDRSFRVLSYSALFGESDDARPDHDETAASVPFLGPGPVPASPRGPKFGECVHSILEHYDVHDANATERHIDERCREFGYGADDTAVVRALVHETFRAEVLPLVSLSALATRRTELEFFFPLTGTRIEDVAAALALDPRYARTEAEFAALRPRWDGLMHGYVDLVFAHEGRYGLIDYKTNFLGTRHEDYAAEPLARAVRASDYDLQYLIYTVALVRQLRARLGARFDYARDFAGVSYLFLRGLAGGQGVHRDVPPQHVIAALDRAFGGRP